MILPSEETHFTESKIASSLTPSEAYSYREALAKVTEDLVNGAANAHTFVCPTTSIWVTIPFWRQQPISPEYLRNWPTLAIVVLNYAPSMWLCLPFRPMRGLLFLSAGAPHPKQMPQSFQRHGPSIRSIRGGNG